MRTTTPLTRLALSALLLTTAAISVAQGPPGQGGGPPPGHGGVPPGQAKKQGDHVPPGQAKKQYRNDYHFQNGDRERFQAHYGSDANHWQGRNRPHFATGQAIPRSYAIRPVPESYWGGVPPPPGYQYGYYDGYMVAYDPKTRIIADVLDLVTAATLR